MLCTKNHAEFNSLLNKVAGSRYVNYSMPWGMRVSDGAQYLNDNYMQTGKKLAEALLNGKCPNPSKLHNAQNPDTLTHQQKAALSVMRDSKTNQEFMAAVRGAVHRNVLSSAAMHIFGPHTKQKYRQRHIQNPTASHAIQRKKYAAPLQATPTEEVQNALAGPPESSASSSSAATPSSAIAKQFESADTMEVDNNPRELHLVDPTQDTGTIRLKKKSRTRK